MSLTETIIYSALLAIYLIVGIFYVLKREYLEIISLYKDVFFKDERPWIKIPIGIVLSIIITAVWLLISTIWPVALLTRFVSNRDSYESKLQRIRKKYKGLDPLFQKSAEIIERSLTDINAIAISKALPPEWILFVTEETQSKIEAYLEKNFQDIESRFLKMHPLGRPFKFIAPNSKSIFGRDRANLVEKLSYNFPSLSKEELIEVNKKIESASVYSLTKQLKMQLGLHRKVHPGFFRVINDNGSNFKCIRFSYFPLPTSSEDAIDKAIWFYLVNLELDRVDFYCKPSIIDSPHLSEMGKSGQTADFRFNYEAHKISKEIATSIGSLKLIGCEDLLIQSILNNLEGYEVTKTKGLHPMGKTLSRLTVAKDFRLFLTDYNNSEVKMPALSKALFLFFLRHPEGVLLSHLSDHESELLEIYQTISFRESFEAATSSIKELVNPLSNSVNEKASRIKGAFVKLMAEDVAAAYHITGDKGEKKRITLDRSLVNWEIDELEWSFEIDQSSEQSDNPEDTINSYYKQALDFLSNKDFKNAESLLSDIIRLNKNHFEAYRLRAVCLIQLSKYQEAEDDNSTAIQLSAKPGIAYHNRSEARLMLGKYREALDDITKYLREVDNKNSESYYIRGLINFELGASEANQDFVNAMILGHEEASRMLERCSGPIPKKLRLEKML